MLGTIKIRLISARNLGADGDYFCKITCGKKVVKSKVAKRTSNPEWNEIFEFELYPGDSVQIELNTMKMLGSARVGGITISRFNDLVKGVEKVIWEGNGLGGKGEIQVGITSVDFGKAEDKKGEINMSYNTIIMKFNNRY
jgi:hypothetical protein